MEERIVQQPDPGPGGTVAGFDVVSVKDMEEYGSRALFYRHPGTGCEVLQLANEDPENLFAFAFRTPSVEKFTICREYLNTWVISIGYKQLTCSIVCRHVWV